MSPLNITYVTERSRKNGSSNFPRLDLVKVVLLVNLRKNMVPMVRDIKNT